MNFGDNMMLLRKKKKLSQSALGKIIGTSGVVIGRYERGDITPSIDVASKIADNLEVSLDYLIGKTNLLLDKEAIDKLVMISKLTPKEKEHIYITIDALIRDFNAKKAYTS